MNRLTVYALVCLLALLKSHNITECLCYLCGRSIVPPHSVPASVLIGVIFTEKCAPIQCDRSLILSEGVMQYKRAVLNVQFNDYQLFNNILMSYANAYHHYGSKTLYQIFKKREKFNVY